MLKALTQRTAGTPRSYRDLCRQMSTLLADGRGRIEALKLDYYWRLGRLMAAYFRESSAASVESEILVRLSEDLNLTASMLYRILQFARIYPEKPRPPLTWSHVKELLAVPDENARRHLTGRTLRGNWQVRRLRREIRKERGLKNFRLKPAGTLKEPLHREPGICRVKSLNVFGGGRVNVVDLGFDIYEPLSGRLRQLKEGASLRWNPEKENWQEGGTKEDFYYYRARLERVVDGDTLLTHIFVRGRVLRRQYLRLRGLDAPPVSEPKGRKAKGLLEKNLKGNPRILVRTHLTDRYDRYIADVWAGGVYLNQALLDAGLAGKASY